MRHGTSERSLEGHGRQDEFVWLELAFGFYVSYNIGILLGDIMAKIANLATPSLSRIHVWPIPSHRAFPVWMLRLNGQWAYKYISKDKYVDLFLLSLAYFSSIFSLLHTVTKSTGCDFPWWCYRADDCAHRFLITKCRLGSTVVDPLAILATAKCDDNRSAFLPAAMAGARRGMERRRGCSISKR